MARHGLRECRLSDDLKLLKLPLVPAGKSERTIAQCRQFPYTKLEAPPVVRRDYVGELYPDDDDTAVFSLNHHNHDPDVSPFHGYPLSSRNGLERRQTLCPGNLKGMEVEGVEPSARSFAGLQPSNYPREVRLGGVDHHPVCFVLNRGHRPRVD